MLDKDCTVGLTLALVLLAVWLPPFALLVAVFTVEVVVAILVSVDFLVTLQEYI